MDRIQEKTAGEGACVAESAAAVGSLPALSAEEAIALQSELLEKYSEPGFQLKLCYIYAREDPRSAAYQQKMSALLRSARAEVLPKYGLAVGEEGAAAVVALGEFHGHPEVGALTACIDDLLHAAESPMVEGSKNLSKRQVLGICRAQVSAFRDPQFQAAMERRVAAGAGPSELALAEQRPILREHGLEANERGAHSLFHQVAQYIMDPEVAGCANAINLLMGMDGRTRQRFLERAMEISVNDPCPRFAKKEQELPPLESAPPPNSMPQKPEIEQWTSTLQKSAAEPTLLYRPCRRHRTARFDRGGGAQGKVVRSRA